MVKNLPLKIQNTATGLSVVCPFKEDETGCECPWLHQLTPKVTVAAAMQLAENHYRNSGHVYID
jgi:hypothetical protein